MASTSTKMLSVGKSALAPFFSWFVRPLARAGINPNTITVLSLIAGCISVWYAFDDYLLFVSYGLLHFVLDIVDGALAREVGPTEFGEWLDHVVVDRLVAFLLVVKAAVALGSTYYWIVAVLFIVHHAIHLISRRRLSVIYIRATLFIGLFLGFVSEMAIVVGTLLVYGIINQLVETVKQER